MVPDDTRKDWKLCRAVYDEGGGCHVEGSAFYQAYSDYGRNVGVKCGWVIGREVQWEYGTHIVVKLEGSKEDLEYVLALMRPTTVGQRETTAWTYVWPDGATLTQKGDGLPLYRAGMNDGFMSDEA